MKKSSFFVFVLLFALTGTLFAQVGEPEWMQWQTLFNERQSGESTVLPESYPGAPPPLAIKEIQVTGQLTEPFAKPVADFRGYRAERCITCHDGVEEINNLHPKEFGCTVCHGGNGESVNKEEAHETLIYDPAAGTGKRNPSSLKVVRQSCGQAYCHSGHFENSRNHIERVEKSLMATMAGVISGLRFQWGGQAFSDSKYGVESIQDRDGYVPLSRGAVPELQKLPFFTPWEAMQDLRSNTGADEAKVSRHIGDSLLRQTCFGCHLDSPGGPGQSRSQGCAACHFVYNPDGKYEGKDPTIPKDEPGHPAFHKMTALPPNTVCLQCHQSFAKSPPAEPEFPARGQYKQDIHFANGMECIDCHTQSDIMGDGNIYSKQHQAVEIRCESCHGDEDSLPRTQEITDPNDPVIHPSHHYPGPANAVGDFMALSSRKRKLTNVKLENNKLIVLGKRSGNKYYIPLVRNALEEHSIPGHKARLECTACHSQTAPRCKGCHLTFDQSRGSRAGESFWLPYKLSMERVEPVLMMGTNGKVAPMFPQAPHTLTVWDERGHLLPVMKNNGNTAGVYRDWSFTNALGYSGSKTASTFSPHSVGEAVRSCASCHTRPRTLGLGEGDLQFGPKVSGSRDIFQPLVRTNQVMKQSDFGPGATVTIRGQALAGTTQTGARPLNQEEIIRVLKVGNCVPCHDGYDDPIYQNIKTSYKIANRPKHRKIINDLLNQIK